MTPRSSSAAPSAEVSRETKEPPPPKERYNITIFVTAEQRAKLEDYFHSKRRPRSKVVGELLLLSAEADI